MALAIDAVLGWPEQLFRLIGHPVTWLGRLINGVDEACNRDSDSPALRRTAGVVATLMTIALPTALAWIVQVQLTTGWSRIVIAGILAWPFVALRSLHDHVFERPQIALYTASSRRLAFNNDDLFRHYPELDG